MSKLTIYFTNGNKLTITKSELKSLDKVEFKKPLQFDPVNSSVQILVNMECVTHVELEDEGRL